MNNTPIIVRIAPTSNPEFFRAEVAQESIESQLSNNVITRRKVRVLAWVAVSKETLAFAGIKDFSTTVQENGRTYLKQGRNLDASKVFGFAPHIKITETTEPRRIESGIYAGKIVGNPKLNPSTQEVLCVNDQPIYRYTDLTVNKEEDVRVQHNSVMDVDTYNALFADQRVSPLGQMLTPEMA